jgi:hypothetical protein
MTAAGDRNSMRETLLQSLSDQEMNVKVENRGRPLHQLSHNFGAPR